MGGRTQARMTGMGAAALLCLAAACLPASAGSRFLRAGDGSLVTVWEQRGRAVPGQAATISSIAFSVTDAAGTRTGVVPPTGDLAQDSAPFLAADGTGSLVLVWSRFDGVYRKIAYARFTAGTWTGFRFLTFGSGDDDLPIMGSGLDGSFLFYVTRPDRYLYAPIDLELGLLFAPPRAIDVIGLGRQKPRLALPGAPAFRGGTDAPIIWRNCRETRYCPGQELGLILPGDGTIQGGTDVPVVISHGNVKASVWGIGGSRACNRLVLVMPSADARTVLVAEFINGRLRLLQRQSLPAQVQERFGETLAESYLPAVCN
ncbi:MAG: hypothetical protein HYS34_04485 [Acidobacteria bacterium]|nr:hypothetical protein [Acidobacteriota bacterium]